MAFSIKEASTDHMVAGIMVLAPLLTYRQSGQWMLGTLSGRLRLWDWEL